LAGQSLWVYTAAFSPNGKRIVTASADHTARVWETSTGRLLATLSAHTARVNYAAFSPDGERIVTASQDNTARIWNTRSGLLLGTLTGHTDQIYTARFSPDGRRIVTASSDNTARIFFADLHDLLAWAKQQLPAEGNTNQLPKSKP
jgi:WD40 repeat protein